MKLEVVDQRVGAMLWGLDDFEWTNKAAMRKVGGLITMRRQGSSILGKEFQGSHLWV